MNDAALLDELACARLMLRIGYFADRHEIDGFVSLFAEDGEIGRPDGSAAVGHAAIRKSLEARPRERLTRHLLTPPLVELAGPDEARGRCYFTMYDGQMADRDEKGELPFGPPVVIGEYEQTYRRTNDGWKIATHRVVPTFRPQKGVSA